MHLSELQERDTLAPPDNSDTKDSHERTATVDLLGVCFCIEPAQGKEILQSGGTHLSGPNHTITACSRPEGDLLPQVRSHKKRKRPEQ